ncbi:pyocin knob domain-containing protein [Enterobacter kobei]|uniref:pyocin knob domain-containing protein n=1 Tax=Enterobacter kobei TaxID=208224 RepID=UPI001EE1C5EA|nr:pyocin knob domain-containing protein [Enterobacter kobei]
MSENNYGALMMKSAIGASDDINAIFQPGIYIIPPSNTSSPDATGGVLTVHSGTPIRRTFTSDSVICLTSTRNGSTWSLWKGPLSRINPFADIKADGAAAVAAALSNLGLREAAKRDVGTGSNQLPDMSAFGLSRNGQTAWDILPNGMIRQAGTVSLTPVGNFNATSIGGVTYYTHYYRVNFPRQFPNAQIATLATLACYDYSNQSPMAGKTLSTHRDTDGEGVSRSRFTVAYTTPNLGEIPTLHFESIGY